MKILPVILSGGSGARLWPVSRKRSPKPFIKMPDGESLLQKCYLRGTGFSQTQDVLTITNRDLFYSTELEYKKCKKSDISHHYVLEPCGKNTAAAIAAATLYAQSHLDDYTHLLILPADHLIEDSDTFYQDIEKAKKLSCENALVIFGVTPTRAETGYGYIETEENSVKKFVEKPTLEKAICYLESGNFLWNSGMFFFPLKTLKDQFAEHQEVLFQQVKKCFQSSLYQKEQKVLTLEEESFSQVESISIDYALMEKAQGIKVVKSTFDWCDVGSWKSFSQASSYKGDQSTYEHNAQNNFVYKGKKKKVVSLVGVQDLVVIDSEDALLVTHKDESEKVKEVYGLLTEKEPQVTQESIRVERPWGAYTVLEENENYKVKKIEVYSQGKLSLQSHQWRSEHWTVVEGNAKVTKGEQDFLLSENQSIYINQKEKHRLENIGEKLLVVIEVQCGSYVGEDDIQRYDDIYNRL